MPGPGRAGDPLGLRREPPRQPHGHAPAAGRLLRRLPRARGRLRPAAAHGPGAAASAIVGFPYRDARGRRGRRVPRPLRATRRVGVAPRASSGRSSTCGPGVTEVYLHPAVDTDELRASHPDWPGRVEDHAFLLRRPVAARPRRARRAPRSSATASCATSSGPRRERGRDHGGRTRRARAHCARWRCPTRRLTADDLETLLLRARRPRSHRATPTAPWRALRRDFDGVGGRLAAAARRRTRAPAHGRRPRARRPTCSNDAAPRACARSTPATLAPRYVWPGVDLSNTAALAFFQDLGFEAVRPRAQHGAPDDVPRAVPGGRHDRARDRRRRGRRSPAASSRTGRTRSAAASQQGTTFAARDATTAQRSRSRATR